MMIVMMTSTLRMLLPSFGGRLYRQSTTPRFCFDDDVLDEQEKKKKMMMMMKPSPPNDSILRVMFFSSSRFSLSLVSSTFSIWATTETSSSFSSSSTFRSFRATRQRLPRKRKTTTKERTYLLCGETPPQKRVCIHTSKQHARVGRGTHGQTSGPRILHSSHDETEQEIWLLQRETKRLPRVAREESRRRRQREIRFARLEKTDVRDSGRIECVYAESVRRERRDEVIEQREVNDFVGVVFKFFDVVDGVVVQEVCLRGITVDWKTQRWMVKEQQSLLLQNARDSGQTESVVEAAKESTAERGNASDATEKRREREEREGGNGTASRTADWSGGKFERGERKNLRGGREV